MDEWNYILGYRNTLKSVFETWVVHIPFNKLFKIYRNNIKIMMGHEWMYIYLDFQKAFDKVPHQRLLIKLKSHGMGFNIVKWIQNWLTDRKERVSVEGETSAWTAVHSEVPQGTVLGPLLFLVYIDDLEDSIASNIIKFADDTNIFRRVQT